MSAEQTTMFDVPVVESKTNISASDFINIQALSDLTRDERVGSHKPNQDCYSRN